MCLAPQRVGFNLDRCRRGCGVRRLWRTTHHKASEPKFKEVVMKTKECALLNDHEGGVPSPYGKLCTWGALAADGRPCDCWCHSTAFIKRSGQGVGHSSVDEPCE